MKNGQLWYNTQSRRVERVIATGPRVCATSFHREDLVGWPNSYMRRATGAEVQEYLDGAEGRRSVVTTEGRLAYA
jgi:hypothetical protein